MRCAANVGLAKSSPIHGGPAAADWRSGAADTGGAAGTVTFGSAAVITDKALSHIYEGKSG